GTIFLDEVGEMSASVQQRLLRVLQAREVTRVGPARPVRGAGAAVAATNRNLAELVEASRFRQDLYYRLAVFPLVVPPLRAGRADIPPLLSHTLQRLPRRRA